MTFEDGFREMGRALDEFADNLSETVNTVVSALSDVFDILQPHPFAEASALRDLSREHNLDAVERNSVRVERVDGTLVAEYHDGVEWNDITEYRTDE